MREIILERQFDVASAAQMVSLVTDPEITQAFLNLAGNKNIAVNSHRPQGVF